MPYPPQRNSSSGNRNDPLNYVTFDDFVAGAASVLSLQTLAVRWNAAHPRARVTAHGDFERPSAESYEGALSCTGTRVLAAVQLVGGGVELLIAGGALLAPEPTGITKAIGAVTLLHGVDTLQSAVRSLVSCDRAATFTEQAGTYLATEAGASPPTARTVGVVTDFVTGAAGSFAIGSMSRAIPAGGRLVHLTTPTSAASIRASRALGLGRSTIYAGPESLRTARGWSILMRTGLTPSQASEALLLPSKANQSFLVVKPIGLFSGWQRISGAVFSAGAGTFNLSTGVFTRTGPATNQLFIYGIDSLMLATARAAPHIDTSGAVP